MQIVCFVILPKPRMLLGQPSRVPEPCNVAWPIVTSIADVVAVSACAISARQLFKLLLFRAYGHFSAKLRIRKVSPLMPHARPRNLYGLKNTLNLKI